jgi:hypothetical protein
MAGWTCAGCTTVYTVGAAKCPQCGSTERTDVAGGSVLPTVTVACGNGGCRYEGRERRVYLRTAAPGVLELPRLACAGCGFEMPTVVPWPPVEEDPMAKIRVHGGVSDANAEPEQEAGEDVSAGTSSSTSSEKEPTSPEPSETPDPSPAPTTGSRSRKARTGSRSASGTDGGQEDGTSAADES